MYLVQQYDIEILRTKQDTDKTSFVKIQEYDKKYLIEVLFLCNNTK